MSESFVADGAAWFTVPAVVGTLFFLLRIVLLFSGAVGDAELDTDFDGEVGDSSGAFKVLSIQVIAAFMMGFGWGGLAGLRAFELHWIGSMIAGVGVGMAMVWVLGLLLKAVHDLQSSGNVQVDSAVGTEGTVYAGIPQRGEGRGQVQIVLAGRQRIYSAISEGDAIPTRTRVRVVRVGDDRTLIVTRA